MRIDHLVVVAATLDEGSAFVADALQVRPGPGGRHALMGTHNRLLSLGPECYLEVIAPDPDAAAPDRPRWFGLDTVPPAPRLAHWVAACDDLRATLGEAPLGMGEVLDLERGDLRWSMAVPRDGRLPGDGVMPALLEWTGGTGAAETLPASGCSLQTLALRHPEMERMRAEWPALVAMQRMDLDVGPEPLLEARIVTPRGLRTLSSLPAAR